MNRITLSAIATAALLAIAAAPATAKRDDHPSRGDKPTAKTSPSDTSKGKSKTKPVSAAIKDCAADGDLDAVYSPGALTRALKRLPADVGTYTDCPDVLRFARTAGPVVPLSRTSARLRAQCTGSAYEVTISVAGTEIGSATVPACKRRAKIVRVPLSVAQAKKQGRRRPLATIVAKPDGKTLQFVARLTGRHH